MRGPENQQLSDPIRRPIWRLTVFGMPLDLLTMLVAVPVAGVLVALLLPLIRVILELLP